MYSTSSHLSRQSNNARIGQTLGNDSEAHCQTRYKVTKGIVATVAGQPLEYGKPSLQGLHAADTANILTTTSCDIGFIFLQLLKTFTLRGAMIGDQYVICRGATKLRLQILIKFPLPAKRYFVLER